MFNKHITKVLKVGPVSCNVLSIFLLDHVASHPWYHVIHRLQVEHALGR